MKIRAYAEPDLHALYAISLATGYAGADASHLYADAQLMGHIYSAPYALLEPGLALVVEDRAGVGGFAVGSADTHAWEDRLSREWWPVLRQRYPDPDPSHRERWTADQRRAATIHHPVRTPATVIGRYPAHLHLNLLPRLQRRGVGRELFEAWRLASGNSGVGPVHVGVNRLNFGAIRFWERRGFARLSPLDGGGSRTLWMGRDRESSNGG